MHVLGSGSMGLLIASHVRKSSPTFPITLLFRDSHRERIRVDEAPNSTTSPNQHVVCELSTNGQTKSQRVTIPAELISSCKSPIDNLIITTKAYDALPALESIRHRLHHRSNTLLLTNGALAVREELIPVYTAGRHGRLFLGSTTHGAYRPDNTSGEYRVVHAGVGNLYLPNEPRLFLELLMGFDLCAVSLTDFEMEELQWKKLSVNCVINPLASIHDCTNGGVLKDGTMLPPAHDILQEISLVLQAMRKNNHDSCSSVTKATLNDFVLNVIHQTKDNSCSMREDVKNGRKTEIEYLNGYIVECGRNFSVPTLANSDIRDQIQRMNTAK